MVVKIRLSACVFGFGVRFWEIGVSIFQQLVLIAMA
jgi:hypothetical protein